jgi:nitric oxide synthase-interacting protein
MLLERMKEEEENDLIKAKLAARDRVLKEFEQTQTGLSATAGVPTNQLLRRSVISSSSSSSSSLTTTTTNGGGGVKRKFDLDSTEIERLTKESEEKAAKKIAIELIESRKAKLPNFWLVRSFHHYFSLSSFSKVAKC